MLLVARDCPTYPASYLAAEGNAQNRPATYESKSVQRRSAHGIKMEPYAKVGRGGVGNYYSQEDMQEAAARLKEVCAHPI